MNKYLLEVFELMTLYADVRYVHNIPYLFIEDKQHFMLTEKQVKEFNEFKNNCFKDIKEEVNKLYDK